MRRMLLIGGIGLGILLAALAAVGLLADVNQYRGRIQAELQTKLGRPVTLGTIGLRFFPLSITADDVTIGESRSIQTGRPFVTVKQLRARVSLLPLLRKEFRAQSVLLRQPSIELARNAAGQWNFSDLGGGSAGTGTSGGGRMFSFDKLQIEDGSIGVTDLARQKARSVYDHIDLMLSDLSPGKEYRIKASARLPGSPRDSLTLEGKGGPLGSEPAALDGRIAVRQASLAALESFLSAGARGKVEGLVSGAADVHSANSAVTAKGALDFKDLRVGSSQPGRPVRVNFDLNHDLKSGLLTARTLKLNVGSVPVTIAGTMNTKASSVDARVTTSRASLAEILLLARTFGAGDVTGSGLVSLDMRVQGPLEPSGALNYSGGGSLENASLNVPALTKPVQVRTASIRFDRNTAAIDNLACSLGGSTMRGSITARNFSAPDLGFNLNIDQLNVAELQQLTKTQAGRKEGSGSSSAGRVNAKGTIDIGSLLYNGLVLNRVHSDCVLNGGVLTLNPLTAEVFGGKQSGSVTVDTRHEPTTVALKTRLDGVDANQLLSATTSLKNKLYGLLAAGADANMTLAPGADIARGLNGNLGIRMTKGRLQGINIMDQISSVGKFLGYAQTGQPFTDISLLAGDMNVRGGVATTDNLRLQMNGGSVAAAGTVNLADQAMNLRLTAVLDKQMSQKVGGNQIGGFLTTALANNNGELVIPALVTGTLANPRFMPDPTRIAELKLKNLLPTAGNPGALTTGALGALTGKKGGVGQSLLDSITGKPASAPPQGAKPQPSASDPTAGILGAIDSLTRKPDKSGQQNKK